MEKVDLLKMTETDRAVREFEEMDRAILLDVRTAQEYSEGHIPGSRNLPLQSIEDIDTMVEEMDVPMYVYCHSGARSMRAVSMLKEMGYTKVKNIGGITSYTGRVE